MDRSYTGRYNICYNICDPPWQGREKYFNGDKVAASVHIGFHIMSLIFSSILFRFHSNNNIFCHVAIICSVGTIAWGEDVTKIYYTVATTYTVLCFCIIKTSPVVWKCLCIYEWLIECIFVYLFAICS